MDKVYVRRINDFQCFDGYIMSKDFSCFKNGKKDWRIVDNKSKMIVVKELPRCEDCWNWIRVAENKQKVYDRIEELKNQGLYAKYVNYFENWIKE